MSTNEKNAVVPTVVRKLIGESHEIQGWIGKLAEHADEAFPAVFERVKKDYDDRLSGVADLLKGHRPDLLSDLDEHRAAVESLQADRDSHTADLEEVRLRHVVGEFSDEQWDSRRTTIESSRDEVDSVLAVEEEAVSELATVVDSVDRIVGSVGPPPPIARVLKTRSEIEAEKARDRSWSTVLSGMTNGDGLSEDTEDDASDDELDFLETVSPDDFRNLDPVVAAGLGDG